MRWADRFHTSQVVCFALLSMTRLGCFMFVVFVCGSSVVFYYYCVLLHVFWFVPSVAVACGVSCVFFFVLLGYVGLR